MKERIYSLIIIAGILIGALLCNTKMVSAEEQKMEVIYEQNSSYSVQIPKALYLDSNGEATYSVRVKGSINENSYIEVIPDSTFLMKDSSGAKEDIQAIVTPSKTQWLSNELSQEYNVADGNMINMDRVEVGTWKGTVLYHISLKEGGATSPGDHVHDYTVTITKEPTCTEDGEKTYTCECGDSYTEIITKLGHNYEDGTCTNCGEKDTQKLQVLSKGMVTTSSVLDVSGNLLTWGGNGYNILGNGTDVVSQSVPSIITSDNTYKMMDSDAYHFLALDAENHIWAWGGNAAGQFGNGTTEGSSVPVQVIGDKQFKDIAVGPYSSGAIDIDGNLWMWGSNSNYELGDGTTTKRYEPVKVKDGMKFVKLDVGTRHSAAIDENGHLWMWGYNKNGEIGDNDKNGYSATTPKMIMSDKTFIDVSVNNCSSTAIDSDGNLWAWGVVFDGTTTKVPKLISSSVKFNKVKQSHTHTALIDENGDLWLGGDNTYGQLGIGNTTTKKSLIKVSGIESKVVDISLGSNYTLVLDKVSGLWAFGKNTSGELGDTTNSNKLTPVRINESN